MRPDDLERFTSVADPQLHPDGTRIAFSVSRMELEQDRYIREIWLWDGEDARPFTHGPKDGSPRWSPDGTRLAFIRAGDRDDDRPQAVVMAADGGEAVRVTDVPLGVREIAWAPDSRRLVAVGTAWIEELADLDDDERKRRPRRITTFPYRADDEGWTYGLRTHLYLVDADGQEEERCLTPGDFDEWGPEWRPDGGSVAFLSRRHEDRETDPDSQVFELDLETDEVRPLTEPGMWEDVTFGPDGTAYVTGLRNSFDWPGMVRVFRREEDGRLVDLTGHLDRGAATPGGPRVVDEGILVLREDRGRLDVVLVRGPEEHEVVLTGDRMVTGIAASRDAATIAFTATDPSDPGELWLLADGKERVLTEFNTDFRDEAGLVETHHFTFERDGVEIDTWALVPEGDDVPLLLNIHGGPTAQYGFSFFDEFQVYAGAGYGVVGINPRGASGRGTEWARAVVGAWQELESVDMLDLRAAVDAALERFPTLSRERIGIMGGSYGGYAAARILAQDDRFSSAVVERGLLVWPSFSGTSDIAMYFDRMFLGTGVDDDPAGQWQASPIAYADRVDTPTLIVHSDHDFRCPLEQAEQLFAAYKRAGVQTELVIFPGEGHELSRSGKPKHRKERFEAILEWHDHHLRGADRAVGASDEAAEPAGGAPRVG